MAEFENYLVAASIFIVALGWIVQHQLDRRNDRLSRHEEIRIGFLIESYKALNYFLHKGLESKADALRFQEVLNTIFLLGRRDLVDAAMKFSASDHMDGRPGGEVNVGTMICELRKQVRDELSLDFDKDDPNSMIYSAVYPDGIIGDAAAQSRLQHVAEET